MSKSTIVENNTSWIIGRGDIDARSNRWPDCGISLIEIIVVKSLSDFEGRSREDIIWTMLGEEAWNEIEEQNIILSTKEDKATYALSVDGEFNFKSCWNFICTRDRSSFMWIMFGIQICQRKSQFSSSEYCTRALPVTR